MHVDGKTTDKGPFTESTDQLYSLLPIPAVAGV